MNPPTHLPGPHLPSQTYRFPFNNWVDSKNGLEHIIMRDGVASGSTALVDYRVVVYTSDIRCGGGAEWGV